MYGYGGELTFTVGGYPTTNITTENTKPSKRNV